MTIVTQARTFGVGDSAEQSHNIQVQQALEQARIHKIAYDKSHRLGHLVAYVRASMKAGSLQARYERLYGEFTAGQPAPFAE